MGMHRSGTTLLTRLLIESGVFFGYKRDPNQESTLFLKINESLLKSSNASWSNPTPFQKTLNKTIDQKEVFAKKVFENNFEKIFLGNKINIDSLEPYSWGWKDPRNTITIDVWLTIFPDAKILNIFRNPIDVAVSLREREKVFSKISFLRRSYQVGRNYYRYGFHVKNCPQLLHLNAGIDLWKQYISMSYNTSHNIMHIKFEDLLSNPRTILNSISNFISFQYNEKTLQGAINKIRFNRKYVFVTNKDLVELYAQILNDKWVIKTGYEKILN